jgi:GPH family glycoside/pentoside/hexuronide:cation symporter
MKKQPDTAGIFVFCLGDFARAILGGLLVTYMLKFFNVTESSGLPLLLPAALIGLLRGVSIVFDAVIDPWIASRSDKSKNPGGRRIPFMRLAALPYAFTCFLIFFPPHRSGVSVANIVWVLALLLAYCLFSSLYLIPYQALQAEAVTDPRRRVFFYSVQSLNFVVGSALIYVLPVITAALRGNGVSALSSWQAAFGIFAFIGAIALIVPAFAIKEKDYVESRPSYLPVLKSFTATLRYRQFRALLGAFLVMQVAFAFFNAAMLYYIDVLLGLKESFATIVLGLSIIIGVSTYPLVNALCRKVGKKPLLLFACAAYTIAYGGIYFYAPIAAFLGNAVVTAPFLVSLAGEGITSGALTCGFLLGVFIAFPIACTNIIPYAAFADIIQYDEIVSGENKAGMFIAARTFLYQFSNAVVTAIVSYCLYIGSEGDYPSVFGVRLTALLASLTILAALACYARYNDQEMVAKIEAFNAQKEAA